MVMAVSSRRRAATAVFVRLCNHHRCPHARAVQNGVSEHKLHDNPEMLVASCVLVGVRPHRCPFFTLLPIGPEERLLSMLIVRSRLGGAILRGKTHAHGALFSTSATQRNVNVSLSIRHRRPITNLSINHKLDDAVLQRLRNLIVCAATEPSQSNVARSRLPPVHHLAAPEQRLELIDAFCLLGDLLSQKRGFIVKRLLRSDRARRALCVCCR
mmetsp:Transcript_12054/g.39658  ORF Transcript_12054/g.39658 Transcript_12054/m.39658 type:complete len:213 (+) Transcript_12054:1088-1726(+)